MKNKKISLLSNVLPDEVTSNDSVPKSFGILRRGIDSGEITVSEEYSMPGVNEIAERWRSNEAIVLAGQLKSFLPQFEKQIEQSKTLYLGMLDGEEIEEYLDNPPYIDALGERFQLLSSRFDESDQQEIISVDFDVMDGDDLLMEDIWMRTSWLSYHEEDASLRFRFSFGMENFEDVSNDPERQLAAAELSQCLFPESALITENQSLIAILKQALSLNTFNFVERIIYFNAPNGGAQFHHDAEKGHLGVVYAQVTGKTFWFALSRQVLMNEIQEFMSSEHKAQELGELINNKEAFDAFLESVSNRKKLGDVLNDPANEVMSCLLNESKLFFNQLVDKEHGFMLEAGDIILLPQESMDNCAWHSVFCIGDEAGQALSFAIKPSTK